MIRAHIRINTTKEAINFVQEMNADGSINKYVITDSHGTYRASARSILAVMYAMTDFNDEMYLVNETVDGKFPPSIDKYRI